MDNVEKGLLLAGAATLIYYLLSKGQSAAGVPVSSSEKEVMTLRPFVWDQAVARGIDPALVSSIIDVESGGDPQAKGAAGELGVMQILPATAMQYCGFAASELLHPVTNIACGVTYLAAVGALFEMDARAMVGAYNAGPGSVTVVGGKYQIINPGYVDKVMSRRPRYVDLWKQTEYQQAYIELFGPVMLWGVTKRCGGCGS